MSQLETLWCEKYRPKVLSDYVFHDENQRQSFTKMVETKSIPHLLLSGIQGTGKTSISKILINECDIDETDVLIINASDENSVDIIRDKIKGFITTYAMGEFKIILLEESDYITPSGQAVLRVLMEEYADVSRFILTCNYENKIIPAIKSRCQHFRFKAAERNSIAEYLAILFLSAALNLK
jgi:replication factor C small subunit